MEKIKQQNKNPQKIREKKIIKKNPGKSGKKKCPEKIFTENPEKNKTLKIFTEKFIHHYFKHQIYLFNKKTFYERINLKILIKYNILMSFIINFKNDIY